jgi:hypothetical protein
MWCRLLCEQTVSKNAWKQHIPDTVQYIEIKNNDAKVHVQQVTEASGVDLLNKIGYYNNKDFLNI